MAAAETGGMRLPKTMNYPQTETGIAAFISSPKDLAWDGLVSSFFFYDVYFLKYMHEVKRVSKIAGKI